VLSFRLTAALALLLCLWQGSCRESNAVDLVCEQDVECPAGMICAGYGLCIEGCNVNTDCPVGQVCSAATNQCVGGASDTDADSDVDSDSDSDGDSDSDSDGDPGCPEPGTVSCDGLSDCADEPEDCTCLDLFDMSGYCYPDCSDCQSPYECVQEGCLYVGQLQWEFDVVIIDPDVGGGGYIEFDLTLESLDVTFVYAYAIVEQTYGYVWLIAVAPEGNDGGHVLQLGIQEAAYGEGELTPMDMGTSTTVMYYDTWGNEHPTGLAVSKWDDTPVLTLTTAGTEVGEHVVGTLDIGMMEYTYDY
jgi:hypothetical protein